MKFKPVLFSLFVVLVLLVVIGLQFLSSEEFTALLVGYGLFALNIMTMALLGFLVVKSGQDPEYTKYRSVALLLGMFKFMVLVLGLYLSLIYFKLSGIHLGGGALAALVVILWVYTTQYLKSFARPSTP